MHNKLNGRKTKLILLFFLSGDTKFFSFFVIKLGHFIANAFFLMLQTLKPNIWNRKIKIVFRNATFSQSSFNSKQ